MVGSNGMNDVKRPVLAPEIPGRRRQRRSRLAFMLGALLLLGIGGLYARETTHALYVRSLTGSVFNTYVLSHKLGQAQIQDDSSGFQSDFCVLHLYHPLPATGLAAETLALLKTYHSLDGGSSLTLRYTSPTTGKDITQASAEYFPAQGLVTMTINVGDNQTTVSEHVQWPS